MAFKVGDTVVMKSGSPIMVVSNVNDKNMYFCQWWNPLTNEVTGAHIAEHLLVDTDKPNLNDGLDYLIKYTAAFKGGKSN